jgi:superfamily I DNA/RNA helicase
VQLWHVFDEYLNILRDRAVRDVDTAYYECRKIAEKNLPNAVFPHIVIDEGQDLSPNAYRLLRVLAGPEHQNDLFIVAIHINAFIKIKLHSPSAVSMCVAGAVI